MGGKSHDEAAVSHGADCPVFYAHSGSIESTYRSSFSDFSDSVRREDQTPSLVHTSKWRGNLRAAHGYEDGSLSSYRT